MRLITFLICLFTFSAAQTQTAWTWTELDTMPFRISNNAVSEGELGGVKHVYTFSGIDSTKLFSGINLNAARYNTQTSVWETIPPLPDTLGKIAAGASTVNNIIYIIGGYHVFANGTEVSSNKVHRYNPNTSTYMTDGASIPVPIDDQVQCVWRDSLIYIITGWSNTANVPDVQIYNPSSDIWTMGTPVNNNSLYRSFGASGQIIGDTIYYYGGVSANPFFVARNYLRKGIIYPNDPTQIVWSKEMDNPGDAGYRAACATYGQKLFWIGGAGIGYNFDGIAYNGSGGVNPLERILHYDAGFFQWNEGLGAPFGIMDLRGIAQISPTSWIICGGMTAGQTVTNRAFRLEYDPIVGSIKEHTVWPLKLYPNPSNGVLTSPHFSHADMITVYSSEGRKLNFDQVLGNKLVLKHAVPGLYLIKVIKAGRVYQGTFQIAD